MKAAVLAAGYAEFPAEGPRTLLPVDGVPILRRTITNLLHAGFDQFVIGTGYGERAVCEAVAQWFPGMDITCVPCPDYRSTLNAATLLRMRPHLAGDGFLLLDGDVVFDREVAEVLVERGPDCLAVRSVGRLGADDVKVTADNEDRVLAIGKHLPARASMGESVGLTLLGGPTAKKLFAALEAHPTTLGIDYYEAGLQYLIDKGGVTLYGVDVGSMYAVEIDTQEDLEAANKRLAQGPAFDTRVTHVRLAI
ncbi:MAG: NTP transferase domain-containing protein [Kofleriaceae bacterium]|nr:NTP transferase domain-containing protein [Kofleriaceae bacterium]